MKKITTKIALILVSSLCFIACSDDVGKVSLGLFTTSDIFIDAKKDPKLPGVTCHISHVEANFDLSDPSNSSIACRQTGPISIAQLATIDKSKGGEVVFTESLSILFKTLKVRRIYDKENDTLVYLSYSTKQTEGSFKHSISTVSLYRAHDVK
ncbi:MAG: CreA family protein [Psychrobium sp.]|nr:CreA family protein [Psychrobium sp.]